MPELHLHLNYKLGRPSEPEAIETKPGWVIFGGKQIQKDTVSTVVSNKTSVTFHDLNENVEKFWKEESYSILPINERKLFSKVNNVLMTFSKRLHKSRNDMEMKLECYGNLRTHHYRIIDY